MYKVTGIMDIKKYGKIKIKLSEMMDKRGITRNKLSTLTGVKYDVVLTRDYELCEGCGKYKRIVECYRKGIIYDIISFCFDIISFPFYLLRIIIIRIYLFFKK